MKLRFKKSSFRKSIVFTAGLALLLSGCAADSGSPVSSGISNEETGTESGQKLKVVASFYPMYEFSKQVGGDHAEIVALIPSGVEPHDWEPSAKDMALIQEADVFVYNGIVEGWAEQALQSAPNDQRIIVEASKGIELMEGAPEEEEEHGHEEEHGDEHAEEHEDEHDEHAEEHGHEHDYALDPHVWLDPLLAAKEVEAIRAAFVQADPANKEDYETNAAAYIAKLQALDEAFRSGLKDSKRKAFITQHAAFGYLAKAYGLQQVPISGLSPEQEPAPDEMADIVAFAQEHQVKTIFFETLVDPKVAETIANELGAKTDVLNPLEGLTEDDQANGLDYIGIMNKNLEALKKALNE